MRFIFLLHILIYSFTGRACNVDVSIQEGAIISFCYGTTTTLHASSGFVSYAWTGPQTSSSMNFAPNVSGQYVVSATDAIGCVSTDTIIVTVYPVQNAVINSSEGTFICSGSTGTMLSVSGSFNSFLWSNGSTQTILQVIQGGTYSVAATDANGCVSNASIFINEPAFDVQASYTLICAGGGNILTASGGDTYIWSTGEVTPSIIVTPFVTTTYTVQISNGICASLLSETVQVVDIPISQVEDTFFIAEGDVIFMNGPDGYNTYNWAPTDNITLSNTQGTTFIGQNNSMYVLTSTHIDGCIRIDTIRVIVIKLNAPTGFSPNGDFINDIFIIPELEIYDGSIAIWDRWGEVVFESDKYQNDWNGTCQSALCIGKGNLPEGTYFYKVKIKGLTFTGFTTIKR